MMAKLMYPAIANYNKWSWLKIGSSLSGAPAYLNMRPICVVIFVTDLLVSN